MKILTSQGALVLLILFVAPSLFAAMPPLHASKKIKLSMENSYFNTSSNFNGSGEVSELSAGHSYSLINSKIQGSYFFLNNWVAFAGANYSYAKSSNTTDDRTNGEVTSLFFGGRKIFQHGRFLLAPEAEAILSLMEVDPQGDEVLTSEGAHMATLGAWTTYDIWLMQPYAYIGYTYRDDGRSSLLPWRVGVQKKLSRWTFDIGVYGYRSITDDEYTDSPAQRQNVTALVDGGSYRFYSINPSLTEVQMMVWHSWDRFSLAGGATHTLEGKNAARGQTYLLSLSYDWGAANKTLKKRTRRSTTTRPKPTTPKEFQPAVETGYDEDLFDEAEDDTSGL